MLIVSSDKKTVVNLNVIESIRAFNGTIFANCAYSGSSECYYELAHYDSDESVNFELNRLVTAYSNGEKVYCMP